MGCQILKFLKLVEVSPHPSPPAESQRGEVKPRKGKIARKDWREKQSIEERGRAGARRGGRRRSTGSTPPPEAASATTAATPRNDDADPAVLKKAVAVEQ